MWARLRRFNALPRPAKAIFLRATLLFPLITVSLRLRGFRATQRCLQSCLSKPAAAPLSADAASAQIQMVSRMVLAAARHSFFAATCLERSLALWWLLARRSIASQLRIGARKAGEQFEAHAWVEHGGVAIGEPEATHLHYAAFDKEFSEELT
jgi:Transglutaminase-like superfamily